MTRFLWSTAALLLVGGLAYAADSTQATHQTAPVDDPLGLVDTPIEGIPSSPETSPSTAAVQTFFDRAAWEAAAGGLPDVFVDFNEFTTDTSFAPPVDLGPFTMEHHGPLSGGRSKVDVLPFDFGDSINGTPYVSAFVDGGRDMYVDITFDSPVWAFAADWAFPGNNFPLEIIAYDAAGTRLLSLGLNAGTNPGLFFGFVTDPVQAIERIELRNRINDGFLMDDIAAYGEGGVPFAIFEVPFATTTFNALEDGRDAYALAGLLQVGEAGDGLDLLNDEVAVTVGTSIVSIPPGSFVIDGAYYVFAGVVDGAEVLARFRELDSTTYDFQINVADTDLVGTTSVVDVRLQVGDDFGEATVRLGGTLRSPGGGTVPGGE